MRNLKELRHIAQDAISNLDVKSREIRAGSATILVLREHLVAALAILMTREVGDNHGGEPATILEILEVIANGEYALGRMLYTNLAGYLSIANSISRQIVSRKIAQPERDGETPAG